MQGRIKLIIFCCYVSIAFVISAGVAPTNTMAAQEAMSKIEVVGNQRIDTRTISSLSALESGQRIGQVDLDKAVKALFNTGYFADVKIERVGNVIKIKVAENPVVNQLAFEGNKEIEDKIFKSQISLKTHQVYTVTKLRNDTKTIYDLYRLKGYFTAKVNPKIIRRPNNRVDVIFEVTEGEQTKVQKIKFVGNKHFSESKLETVIQTKESRWYRFFTTDDSYDRDRLDYDQELLRQYYLQHGYVDFQVLSAVAELTPDQKEFFITFTLSEGERYKFAVPDVVSQIKNINVEELRNLITFQADVWYDVRAVDKTIGAITEYLGNSGYAFVDVQPKVDKDQAKKSVKVTFEVQPGPPVFIDRIMIRGNLRTDDDVVRRELRIQEGDAFNTYKVKESERRIRRLGFFKKVSITRQASDAPDKVNLVVQLDEEDSTGELWVSGGYSTSEGIIGNVGFMERNMFGRAQELRTSFTLAKRRREFDFGYTEPYFMERPLRAGFDLFNMRSTQYYDSAFAHNRTGGNLRAGYEITEYLGQTWTYTLRSDEISGVRNNTSRFLAEQKGKAITSMISHDISYNRIDNPIEPTGGYVVGTTNQLAGLGGKVKYTRNNVHGRYFYSILEELVLGLSAQTGVVKGLSGQRVRIVDMYSVGGDGDLRGFEASGVNPRDKRTKDPLGGRYYYLGTAELEFPLGLPNEFGIKGAVFSDIGSTWNSGFSKSEVYDTSKPRVSAGFGVTWRSPIGPLRIDIAKAMKKQRYDKTQTIHFGFSTRF